MTEELTKDRLQFALDLLKRILKQKGYEIKTEIKLHANKERFLTVTGYYEKKDLSFQVLNKEELKRVTNGKYTMKDLKELSEKLIETIVENSK